MGSLEEVVRGLLEEGHSEEEVREALLEEGYRDSVIDAVLEDVGVSGGTDTRGSLAPEDTDSGTGHTVKRPLSQRILRSGWLLALLAYSLLYLGVGLTPFALIGLGGLANIISLLLGVFVGLLSLFSLFLGAYWIITGDSWFGAMSLLAGLFTTAAVVTPLVLLAGPLGAGAPLSQLTSSLAGGASPGLQFQLLLSIPTALLLVTASLNTAMWREHRIASWLPLLTAIFVVGGMYAFQATMIQPVQGVDNPAVDVFRTNPSPLYDSATGTMPPYGKLALYLTFIGDASSTYVTWYGLLQSANSTSILQCGSVPRGDFQGIRSSLVRTAVIQTHVLNTLEEERTLVVDVLYQRCQTRGSCTASRAVIRDQLSTHIEQERAWLVNVEQEFNLPEERVDELASRC